MTPETLMAKWLTDQLPPSTGAWLLRQRERLRAGVSEQAIHLSVTLVPRRLGTAALSLDPEALAAAHAARPGWDPRGWTVDQAGRLVLLLADGAKGPTLAARLQTFLDTADLSEVVCLMRGLPLYPDPTLHLTLAQQGACSAMPLVFEAVVQSNPYPAEMFDEAGWNALVLKALAVGLPLTNIQGLERRANRVLSEALRDHAQGESAVMGRASWSSISALHTASALRPRLGVA